MKKIKMLSAALAALCMAVSLASCGGTDNAADTSKTETTTTTTASETEDKTAEAEAEMKGETTTTAAAETPEESQAETESTAEDNNAAYAYFDELNAEYESEGDTTCKPLTNDIAHYKHSLFGTYQDSSKIWTVDEDGNGHLVDQKEKWTDWDIKVKLYSDYIECAGYVYYVTLNTSPMSLTLRKMDIQGNEVASAELPYVGDGDGSYISYITPDGHVIVNYNHPRDNNFDGYYVYSPDLQTKTEITTKPQFKNEHGEMIECEKIPFGTNVSTNSPGYKNKALIWLNAGSAAWFDCDTMEWEYLELPEEYGYGFDCSQTIGKYAFCKNTIYDMEKQEIVYTFGEEYPQGYYGGDAFISRNNEFYRLAPESGEKETVKKCDNVTKVTAILDYDRYVVVDDYGVFVHTFEKGDSEETKALSFE